MDELIVDFPCKRRTSTTMLLPPSLPPARATRRTAKRRSVRFANTSQLIIIERPTPQDLKLRRYTKQERDILKLQFKIDVYKTRRMLITTPMNDVREDELYECVGMELYLTHVSNNSGGASQDNAEAAMSSSSPSPMVVNTLRRRADHIRAVLDAQDRQRALRIRDLRELALISRVSSEATCLRAHSIADMYWKVLKN